MLSTMRKHANSMFMWVLFAAIIGVFIFTFGQWGGADMSQGMPVAAMVNGETLAPLEVDRSVAYQQQLRERFGNFDRERDLPPLIESTVDGLIDQMLFAQEAKRIGLGVTDQALGVAAREQLFAPDELFSSQEYIKRVQERLFMTPAQFENLLTREILAGELRTTMRDGIVVTEGEAREAFNKANTEYELELIRFDPQAFQVADVTEAEAKTYLAEHQKEVRSFYDEHINRYREPAPEPKEGDTAPAKLGKIKPFNDVKIDVATTMATDAKRQELVENAARTAMKAVSDDTDLSTWTAKKLGLPADMKLHVSTGDAPPPEDPTITRAELSGKFSLRNDYVPRVGVAPELVAMLPTMKVGEVVSEPLVVSGRTFVVKLKSMNAADPEDFADERETIVNREKDQRLASLMEDLRKKLRARGSVKKMPENYLRGR